MNANSTWERFRKAMQLLAISSGMVFFCVPAFAQLNYGRIYGAITDQSGGAVSGATVTVIDVDRGIPRTLVADDTGEYSASSFFPATIRFAPSPRALRPPSTLG